MLYNFYKYFTIIFSPLITLFLYIRILFGKEDKKRIKERFGTPGIKRPEGDVIWFLCASVGEANAALSLIDRLLKLYDNKITVLLTTTSVTSANMLQKKLADKPNVIHQYTPIDTYKSVMNFLDFWQPIALINIESEIWPNIIALSHKYCRKVIIATAKMSTRSFRRWRKLNSIRNFIFNQIDICYPQSDGDEFKLRKLGIEKTIMLGNLKFDCPVPVVDEEYLAQLKGGIGDRKFICLASTHIEELEMLYKLYTKVEADFKNILFIFAIRHPNKGDETEKYLKDKGLIVKRRSRNDLITPDTNIYMYDEIGKMGTFYALSDIVVVCGSFVNHIGGHTPIEVIQHKCATLTAPYIKNNKVLFQELEKYDSTIICKDKHNIIQNMRAEIKNLINNPARCKEIIDNSYNTKERFKNIAHDMAKSIKENIEN
ncbi:MAG: lipid IV(A) 3-deoxy-D-manno-octulosonic acid transferase [Rickettsiales bacterium]|nr:MAG: lipid IV(A) 3-deoxy-D-manno-octulosonic acid transferase [Rickettsiales bacterium]